MPPLLSFHGGARSCTLALTTAIALGLSACGGGGDVAGVGQGGTGAFSVGPITGLGSIIVNGIRYDDSRASISARCVER